MTQSESIVESLMAKGESIDILVVEDNDEERDSIVKLLQESIGGVRIVSVRDGSEALDFLFARGNWVERVDEEPPKLILLDLELSGSEGGLSILGKIRLVEPQDALTVVPIVVFTDSHDADNIKDSYRLGANSYVIKPLSFPDFKSVVESVGKYWMTLNESSRE